MSDKILGWKYYNHAAIPTAAPHEKPDLTPIKDGSIWHIDGKKPLIVRYTTDWDCGYDTGWWYIIKDAPFDIESLSKNSRKHIRASLRKVRVENINPVEYAAELFECYKQAFSKYKLADNETSYEYFEKECKNALFMGVTYWAGFDLQDNRLVGYMTTKQNDCWAEIYTAKFDPRFLNLLVSDALYATVLEHYLNKAGLRYVSSGSRSINHMTNTQEYKEQHFGYRKCYCKLHVVYRQSLKLIVAMAYPFRRLVHILGGKIGAAHHLSAILKMEEIARTTSK